MYGSWPKGRDPQGVTLRVAGRSLMGRAYDDEASTDRRWVQAQPVITVTGWGVDQGDAPVAFTARMLR